MAPKTHPLLTTLRVRVVLRVWWGTTVKSEICISALSVVLCKLFCEKSVIYLRMLGATTKIMRRSDVIHPRCTDAGLRNSTVPTERVANIVRSAQALLQPLLPSSWMS